MFDETITNGGVVFAVFFDLPCLTGGARLKEVVEEMKMSGLPADGVGPVGDGLGYGLG